MNAITTSEGKMTIPILINSRDRLTWTRELAEWCRELPDARVIVCDNDSSYPPLLEWLDKLERTPGEAIEVVRFGENAGPRGPWRVPLGDAEHFVVTDPDLGMSGIPLDVLEKLRWSLDEFTELVKSGLAIRVDDLPQTAIGDLARSTEARFWLPEQGFEAASCQWFHADIDTTFAMYRNGRGPVGCYNPALRLAGVYQCRHLPWYVTDDLSDEERYYLAQINASLGLFYSPKIRDLTNA